MTLSDERSGMKRDSEVLLMRRERAKGRSQEQAAARAGMSVRTLRRYERRGTLPSQLQEPRTYLTRPSPFAEDWPWIASQLERDPALQGTTLFGLLKELHPGRYQAGQLRTLHRQIAAWRAQYGPGHEVIFPQIHEPGEAAQSDFTYMNSLGVTLGGVPFPHLVFHLVLVYSNVEAIQICFSESYESLVEGFETCLWRVGGVPRQHRTDHLSAAIRPLDPDARTQARERYRLLMAHYHLEPTTNNVGVAHENGDVEQEHYRFKDAVDQALRVRGSRDFANRGAYDRLLQQLVSQRNLTRQVRWAEERQALRPLPHHPRAPEHVLGPLAPDRHDAVGAGALRDAGGLPRHCAFAQHAAAARDRPALHRLPPRHLVVGAQARRVRTLSLPRRSLSQPDLPPCVRRAPGPSPGTCRSALRAAAASGRQHVRKRDRDGTRVAARTARRADFRRGAGFDATPDRPARSGVEPTAAGPERVRPAAQPGGSPCLTARPRCG